VVIDFVQSGGDRLVVVILYEALDGNAVEVTSRDAHALRELVGRFEDGIGDGDGCLHALRMTGVRPSGNRSPLFCRPLKRAANWGMRDFPRLEAGGYDLRPASLARTASPR